MNFKLAVYLPLKALAAVIWGFLLCKRTCQVRLIFQKL